MTIRLVALMSVVLLLSLGAVGVIVSHYQDQVLAEVAHTAVSVGQAALSTLDVHDAGSGEPGATAPPAGLLLWHPQGAAGDSGGQAVEVEVKALTRSGEVPGDAPATDPPIVRRRIDSRVTPEGHVIVECLARDAEEQCTTKQLPADVAFRGNVFVRLEDIRAEPDSADELVLKIPRFLRAAGDVDPAGDPSGAPKALQASLDEIHMPISLEEYGDLFSSVRERSLFVFCGVFVVGTVLSAGLAARFTRPIRRLDAGIRRLSAGDLDVQVDVRGKDEIARLGRAFNDMTRSLRANRERVRELVRREKLSALGRLAAGVAHDVRNPLHSIGLTLQHLRETGRPENPERAAEFDRSLEVIRGEIRRLDGLVGNFLRFAATDRRERRPIDLGALLRETCGVVQKEAEWRRVEIVLETDAVARPVRIDAEAVRSAVLNLVLNSFEAMPDGGKLTLRQRVEGDEVIVEVQDTGVGIPEEDRERVFDFAYSTREGGNGLGLAMVHQCVVEDHGGRVSLHSHSGDGTTVRMAFPRGESGSEAVA